jgi:hypothetical protein
LHNISNTQKKQTRFKLFFLDEPNAPGKPDIIDYDNKSVTLKWEPPKSDGGRPITHYVIEMLNKYQPDWVELMPTETNACEFKVPGLKERMAYQFRVRAVNKAGKSAPSPPTESHIVRHRNRKCRHRKYRIRNFSRKIKLKEKNQQQEFCVIFRR